MSWVGADGTVGGVLEDELKEAKAALMVRWVNEARDSSIEETVFNVTKPIRIVPTQKMKDRGDDGMLNEFSRQSSVQKK